MEFGCPPTDSPDSSWPTTHEEYIKFASRLMNQRSGKTADEILERYKTAWTILRPNDEIPLTDDGKPIDFLWEPIYPCPKIPWMKDIPKSNSLTGI